MAMLALLALAPVPAWAQEAEPSDLFSQSVEVRVVNIDVFATDKKGRPITGLTKDDFVLTVDYRPAEIEYFYAPQLIGESPTGATGDEIPPSEALGFYAPGPAADPLIVIYIDNYWLTPPERLRVLDDVQQFVQAQADASRRFLLVTHDPSITIRTPITRDTAQVVAAL